MANPYGLLNLHALMVSDPVYVLYKAFRLLARRADKQGFTPCTDQQEINNFINEVVPYMQENSNIQAYAYSNGLGLGDVWPLTKGDSLRYFSLVQRIKNILSFSSVNLGGRI